MKSDSLSEPCVRVCQMQRSGASSPPVRNPDGREKEGGRRVEDCCGMAQFVVGVLALEVNAM